jgi:hypothetical protein
MSGDFSGDRILILTCPPGNQKSPREPRPIYGLKDFPLPPWRRVGFQWTVKYKMPAGVMTGGLVDTRGNGLLDEDARKKLQMKIGSAP